MILYSALRATPSSHLHALGFFVRLPVASNDCVDSWLRIPVESCDCLQRHASESHYTIDHGRRKLVVGAWSGRCHCRLEVATHYLCIVPLAPGWQAHRLRTSVVNESPRRNCTVRTTSAIVWWFGTRMTSIGADEIMQCL